MADNTSAFMSRAGALVITGAGVLGVAYGIAKYVNDFENAKAEIQNLRGQIAQLHEVLAKTNAEPEDPRLSRLEQQVADLVRAQAAAPSIAAAPPPAMIPVPAPAPAATPAPPPAPVSTTASAEKSIRDHLESGQFSGSATDGNSVWPFTARKVAVSGSDQFEAEIEWPTLNAVHRIEGRFSDKSLFFKETAFVKKGQNVIGCEYTLNSDRDEGLAGTYRNCDGNAAGGTIELNWF